MRMKRIISLTIVLLLCVSAAISASAVTYENKFEQTQTYLQTLTPQVGSVGGEWLVTGLSRADALTQAQRSGYLQNAEGYVRQIGSAKLHRSKSSDNSRVVLALTSLGTDARDFCGFDLTSPLFDLSYVQKQGINGVIWALLALDSARYPAPESVREDLLYLLLQAQHSDGGWGLDENISDPDVTAMALTALAPYRFFDAEVLSAVENGLALLQSLQQENGGYSSYDSFNPESCAQVITALCALGIDPEADARFCQSGQSLIDSMLRFSVENGFCHTLGGSYNQMATEQAFYAMTAFERMKSGRRPLFDMADRLCFSVQSVDEATALQRYLAEFPQSLTVSQKMLSDMNGDGRLSVSDVTEMQRLLAQ